MIENPRLGTFEERADEQRRTVNLEAGPSTPMFQLLLEFLTEANEPPAERDIRDHAQAMYTLLRTLGFTHEAMCIEAASWIRDLPLWQVRIVCTTLGAEARHIGQGVEKALNQSVEAFGRINAVDVYEGCFNFELLLRFNQLLRDYQLNSFSITSRAIVQGMYESARSIPEIYRVGHLAQLLQQARISVYDFLLAFGDYGPRDRSVEGRKYPLETELLLQHLQDTCPDDAQFDAICALLTRTRHSATRQLADAARHWMQRMEYGDIIPTGGQLLALLWTVRHLTNELQSDQKVRDNLARIDIHL